MRSFDGAEGEPVIRVLYLAPLVGGLVTSVTSNNGFYNFPIGGLAAAALAPAVLVPRDAPWKAVAGQCGLLFSTVVLFCISAFGSVYGETSNPLTTPAVRIKDGMFAGLLTTIDQAAFITSATAVLGNVARSRDCAHKRCGCPVRIRWRRSGTGRSPRSP
jgi:hypothetical protein